MSTLNFNEEQFKNRIRERILNKINNKNHEGIKYSSKRIDLQPLIDAHNISDADFFSQRKVLGKLIIFCKKVLRKLMYPILLRQIQFNQRVIDHLYLVDQNIEDQKIESLKLVSLEMVDEIIDELKMFINDALVHKSQLNNQFIDQLQKASLDLQDNYQEKLYQFSNLIEMNQMDINNIKDELQKKSLNIEKSLDKITKQNNDNKEVIIQEIEKSHSDSIVKLLKDIAELESSTGNYERSYYFMLLALKINPQDMKIENQVIELFERLNRSRFENNESI